MTQPTGPDPALLPAEEDEAIGLPTFELLVRDGQPVVSGSYFLHPPLRAVAARWDPSDPTRLLVKADDGTDWYAADVPTGGQVSVVLRPVDGDHPALTKAHAVIHLAGAEDGA